MPHSDLGGADKAWTPLPLWETSIVTLTLFLANHNAKTWTVMVDLEIISFH
jgi:hypothetical protein